MLLAKPRGLEPQADKLIYTATSNQTMEQTISFEERHKQHLAQQRRKSHVSLAELLEQYKVWLRTQDKYSHGTIRDYQSYLRSLDQGSFLSYQLANPSQQDYLVELVTALRQGQPEELQQITTRMEQLLASLIQQHKQENKSEGTK